MPSIQAIVGAMSGASRALLNPELADGSVLRDKDGRPEYAVGRLTVTFVVDTARGRRAVRVFHQPIAHADDRYRHVVDALQVVRDPQIAWFRYLPDGIRVDGAVHPVAVRPWIDGVNLNRALAIDRSHSRLGSLQSSLTRIVTLLQAAGLAHGNIHHGNLILSGDHLVLVDPECMYTPRIRPYGYVLSPHRNYRHPSARPAFNEGIDIFPVQVIRAGLSVLAEGAHTWFTFDNGDNILFSEADLRDPTKSPIFGQASSNGQAPLSGAKYLIESLSVDRSSSWRPTRGWAFRRTCRALGIDPSLPIISSLDIDAARGRVGQVVMVVGRVHKAVPYDFVHPGSSRVFLNFGPRRNGAITALLGSVQSKSSDLATQFDGQWVFARGYIRASGGRFEGKLATDCYDLAVMKGTNIRVISPGDAATLLG